MGEILIDKTKEKFGYDIKDLRPNSCKLVVWKCGICEVETDKKYVAAKKINLCLMCSNKINANTSIETKKCKISEWYKTHVHPLKGTKRPEHVKEALKKSNIGRIRTDKEKENLSIRTSGENNPMFGKKHTEESLIKMRKIQKEIARRGEKCNFYGKCYHGKGNWYECKDGTKIWMRSSWEIKFAKYLDENNINWEFEIKTFPIIYDNKEGTYTPDFYLIDENKYIEIKGRWRGDAETKYIAFIKQYENISIEIYEMDKLKELKIL